VTPPFKPVVESDESTANFDPEFTSADIRDVGLTEMDLDEEDPSEDWVSQSIGGSGAHTYNGPLGSDRDRTNATNGTFFPGGIQIKRQKHKKDLMGSPLTSSVQENFRGFTYSGGESVVIPPGILKSGLDKDSEEAVEDEEVTEVTTEDEYEDTGKPAGRYANAQRNRARLDDEMQV
jgi:hypothetical protein